MRQFSKIGLTAAAGVGAVMFGLATAWAQELELAATPEPDLAAGIQQELDQAGFYGVTMEQSTEERMMEAIADFEHHVGWPETGQMTPALLSALQEYNANTANQDVEF